MDDTISRTDAIDVVKKNTFRLTFAEEQNCEGRVAWSADAVYSDVIEGALRELPSAQPNLQPTCNQLATDCISRAAAIDAHCELCEDRGRCNGDICPDVEVFRLLPSAQPERKKGKWILECDAEGEGDNLYRCPECGCNYSCQEYDIPNFCPNCGSYNGGESDDKG